MVHRIQNRNAGYSDFSQVNVPSSFNFNSTISNTAVDGANALKLDNEILSEFNEDMATSNVAEETSLETQDVVLENRKEEVADDIMLDNKNHEEQNNSNGLENFQLEDDDTPELFDSGSVIETENNDQEFSSFQKDQNEEDEDELEIPAFLRRQKN